MRERFTAADRRFVGICLGVALVCGIITVRYFGRAFPEASIHFAVNRSQSETVARDFLVQTSLPPAGYEHAAIFDYDDASKTFLERKLGLERAQEVYGKQVRLWRWSHRWFKPHQKEELRVDVTASGDIASFSHLLSEDAPGGKLEPDSARALAEAFLASRMQVRLADYDFVEGSARQLPQRVDHEFTWKKRGLDLGDPDATYRISVTVAGDQVTGYDEHLEIPQAWQDDYARLRARNETAALVATVFIILTGLAMVTTVVLRIRDRDVRWPVVVGFGAVAFVLQLLSALNQFDLEKFAYATQDSYASFLLHFFEMAVLGALAYGGVIVVFTAAAEPLYRERFGDKLSLSAIFTPRGLQTKRFFKEVLLGLVLMLFFGAYQSVFYVLAARAGAWAPLEVPYSNMLNTAIPWALVLFIGFFPAVSEEFLSRMFSVPFLTRSLPRLGLRGRPATVTAAVLASFIWGFAHANYPNQPFWIRGVEVGVAGLVVSFVMIRWGILAALVWHYTVDAFYTALLMLRSGNAYFVVSGAVTAGIMLVPLAAALLLYWRQGGFATETGLLNRDVPGPRPALPPPEAVPVPPAGSYVPVPRRRMLIGAAVAAALLLLFFIPVDKPGDGIQLVTQREQAVASARAQLQRLGADPARYRVNVQMASRFEPPVGRYLLERWPLSRVNALFATRLRTPVWRVRFWRPDEREEYVFNLPVNQAPATAPGSAADAAPGSAAAAPLEIPLWAFEHVLPDSTPGDTLGLDAAQVEASDFLRVQNLEPADLDLKESHSERQKARTDHTFEWQIPDSTLGEAGVRYLVMVKGGEVAGMRPYVHLPEAWLRAYEERSVVQRLLWVLSRGVLGAIVLAIVALFVAQVRARRFNWGEALRWGAAGAIMTLILFGLRWQSDIMMRYETNLPYQLFLVTAAITVLVPALFLGVVIAVLAGTTFAVRPTLRQLFAHGHDRRWVRDGLLLALVGIVLQVGVRRLGAVLTAAGARHADIRELLLLPAAARPLPWLDVCIEQLQRALWALPLFALLVHVATRYLNRVQAVAALGIVLLLFAAEGAHSPAEFDLQLAIAGASAAMIVFTLGYLFRSHELAYVVAFIGGRMLGAAIEWMSQPAPGAFATGLGLVLVLLGVLALLCWRAMRQASSAARSSTTEG
jgi:membrane protease YdiL (CAAX protease family)